MKNDTGKAAEGWAFTFCKGAFLVLICQLLHVPPLLALSGIATILYIAAYIMGVREWRCWAKPPWVTLFWAGICLEEIWRCGYLPLSR
jgi:hypothetical protein